jgi:predicted Zn-dependent protease
MGPRNRRLIARLLLAGVWAGAVGGAAANPLDRFTKVSVAQERDMGAAGDAFFREHLTVVDDPEVAGFLHDLGQGMVRQLGEQPFVYRFRVVIDPDLNAFALPGGAIYFNSGTILAAGSLDELAGVMAHEIAHAKRRHVAQMYEKSTIPDLLAQVLGVGLAVATDNMGPMIVAQGVSESLKLAYTREAEGEADDVGTVFMARGGYDPMGMAIFFDRLAAGRRGGGYPIPAYLRSHPQIESRMEGAVDRARKTTVPGEIEPGMHGRFRAAQLRLGLLEELGRTTLTPGYPPPDRQAVRAAQARASELVRQGLREDAIAVLREAQAEQPTAPSLAFQEGQLLREAGRDEEAAAAYRQAIKLDPETALAHFRLGQTWRDLGDEANAVFWLEQAEGRFEPGGRLQLEAQKQVRLLVFPFVTEAGLADGEVTSISDTPAGQSGTSFPSDARRVVWWARIDAAQLDHRGGIRVHWIDPQGAVVGKTRVESAEKPWVVAPFELPKDAPSGTWRAEAFFEGTRLDRHSFELVPAGSAPQPRG